jgi:hypothetical protein
MDSREQQVNDLFHYISVNGGKIVSPPGMLPITFECHLASQLPQQLAFEIDKGKFPGASLSFHGSESRIDPTAGSEIHRKQYNGVEYKNVTPHIGFVDYHRYQVSLNRLPVPE